MNICMASRQHNPPSENPFLRTYSLCDATNATSELREHDVGGGIPF